MPVSMDALADDLAAESAVLRALLAPLAEAGWRPPTPGRGLVGRRPGVAPGVLRRRRRAVRRPTRTRFQAEQAQLRTPRAAVDPDSIAARVPRPVRRRAAGLVRPTRGPRLIDGVPRARPVAAGAVVRAGDERRVVAHRADHGDLGARAGRRRRASACAREPTARLRHVAHIGIGARAYSYVVNGREVPDHADPGRARRARRRRPGRGGPEDAADRVDAARRWTSASPSPSAATSTTSRWWSSGPVATEWMSIRAGLRRAPPVRAASAGSSR